MNKNARVAPCPKEFREKFPDEPWYIWVHKQACHFEWDSFGASAGFMEEGTEVQMLKRWRAVKMNSGPLAGEAIDVVKVRGPNQDGKQITGWALAGWLEGLEG